MRRIVLVCASFLIAAPAFAAKVHRESKKDLEGKAKAAETEVKAACGCAPKLSADWKSFEATPADKAEEFAKSIGHEFENVSKTAKEFCSDADSKKLFCANVKKVSIVCKDDVDAKFNERDKTMEIHTTSQMNSGGFKMKTIMEAW
jgi:hypothetical protein